MQFELEQSIAILERTPAVISTLLTGLDDVWLHADEGKDTWSPYDVVQHLLHTERTNWIPRMEVILSPAEERAFPPFDRFAHLQEQSKPAIADLIAQFTAVRRESIAVLTAKEITAPLLDRTGLHPQFGVVTLRQLLATWTVHDMTHLTQIIRVMAKQYRTEVGSWIENLSILR